MPRLNVLALSSLLFVGAGGAASAADPPAKPSILFINIEDCNAGVWGCYGNPICKTPNIDRFAATAVRFDSAYCQAICCNPTRTSFLTGLRPPSTGVFTNGDVMDEHLPPGTLTLPEMLKPAGFTTAVIGKLFHLVDYAEKPLSSFDRIEFYARPPGWKGPGPILPPPPPSPRLPGEKAQPAPKDRQSPEYRRWLNRNSDRYGDSGRTLEQERDFQMAETASALLKEFSRTGERFFLAVSQSRPHTPLVAPKRYIDMYDPAAIPMPPAPADSLRGFPAAYVKRSRGGNPDLFMQQQPTPQQAREAIAAYYACVSFVDDNVGRILRTLDESGLADSTIVVFLGDHGFHLGDHNFWSKYSMLEATRRVTLIVRAPGHAGNGKTCTQFVEFVDLVPTLADLAGFDVPANLEGTSFRPLLQDPATPWKTAVFMSGNNPQEQVVRNRDFSYMTFKAPQVPAALFDLKQDPWETVNVVDDPAYAEARRQMAALLAAGWKSALPPTTP